MLFLSIDPKVAWDLLADRTEEFVVVYPLGSIAYLYTVGNRSISKSQCLKSILCSQNQKGSVCIGGSGLCGHTWNGGACCFSTDVSLSLDLAAVLEKEPPKQTQKTPKIIGAGYRYIVILAQDDSSFLLDAIAAVRDELPSILDKV